MQKKRSLIILRPTEFVEFSIWNWVPEYSAIPFLIFERNGLVLKHLYRTLVNRLPAENPSMWAYSQTLYVFIYSNTAME